MQSDMKVVANAAQKKPRDTSVELYRVSLMFGICLLHSITFSDHIRPWLANILLSCVNGFVFISGWYGMRFAPSKVLRLYGVSLYAALVVVGIQWISAGSFQGVPSGLLSVWRVCRTPWFLNAYLFLMLLAPVVDAALDRLDNRQLPSVLAPFFILTFGWSFGTGLPILSDLLPKAEGLGSYTGLTLLCVYVVGRLCRRLGAKRAPVKWLFVALVPLLVLTAVGLGEYASPFATGLAMVTFLLFRHTTVPTSLSRVVVYLGPSMFAVYLLHTNSVGISFLIDIQRALLDTGYVPLYLAFVLSALAIFVASVVIDMLRRAFCLVTRPLLSALCHSLDTLYGCVVDWLGRSLSDRCVRQQ